jgi:hypothetical protein
VPPLAVNLLHPPAAHRANEWHEAIPENEHNKEACQKPDKTGQTKMWCERLHCLLVVKGRTYPVSDHAPNYRKGELK